MTTALAIVGTMIGMILLASAVVLFLLARCFRAFLEASRR